MGHCIQHRLALRGSQRSSQEVTGLEYIRIRKGVPPRFEKGTVSISAPLIAKAFFEKLPRQIKDLPIIEIFYGLITLYSHKLS